MATKTNKPVAPTATLRRLKTQAAVAETRLRMLNARAETRYLRAALTGSTRYRATQRTGGYKAVADTVRKEGSRKVGGGADGHLTPRRLAALRNECRDNERNNPIFKSVGNRIADLTVGRGLPFRATTKDKEWNRWIEARVEAYLESCDVSGRFGNLQFQRWLAKEPALVGDCMVSMLGDDAGDDAGQVQLIEAEEVDGGAAFGRTAPYGVLRDGVGRLTTVYLRSFPVGAVAGSTTPVRTEAIDGAFVLVNEILARKSQTRGEPGLAVAIEVINELFSYLQTVLTAGELAAKIALLTKTKSPAAMKSTMPGFTQRDTRPDVDPNQVKSVDMEEGVSILNVESDDTVQTVSSTHPQVQLPDYMRAMIRMAGAPMGIPLELLLMDWTGVSYSGGRVSLYFAYECAADNRDRVKRILRKIVEWKMAAFRIEYAAEMGRSAPGDWRRFRFSDPVPVSLDPLKEAMADKIMVDNNMITLTDAVEKRGGEYDAVMEQRDVEVKEQAERGITPPLPPGTVGGGAVGATAGDGSQQNAGDGNTDNGNPFIGALVEISQRGAEARARLAAAKASGGATVELEAEVAKLAGLADGVVGLLGDFKPRTRSSVAVAA